MPSVTMLTAHAAADDLGPDDYRAIYDELRDRGRRSLRDFVELTGSRYSIAWWSRYEAGDLRLTRAARNELRRAVNLPQLPPAVAELLADPAVVSPDAAIYRVGVERADRAVLIGQEVSAIDLHVNSSVAILAPSDMSDPSHTSDHGPALEAPVTPVTRTARPATRKTIRLPIPEWERLNTARTDAGYTWPEFLAALYDHWSQP